jgi:hypothetical protein
MKIELEISEYDIVNQNEYADWFCNRADWTRIGDADNGQVNIKDNKSSKTGVFDLIDLDVKWDDQSLFDVRQIMIDLGEIYNLEEDFDVSNFIWGKSTETGKHILCGI